MRKKTFTTPKLIPLDMSLCFSGNPHDLEDEKSGHPDINAKDTYLCLIDGQYFSGKFSPQWYGWTFDGCNIQFDPPGTNSSDWQQIWEIVAPKTRKVRHPENKCTVK